MAIFAKILRSVFAKNKIAEIMKRKFHNCVNSFHNYVMFKMFTGLSLGSEIDTFP